MIFGRKRKEQAAESQLDVPQQAPVRSLYRSGRSQFEPPELAAESSGESLAAGVPADEDGVPNVSSTSADRPRVVFTAARSGPSELLERLPISGELAGVIPGPDRPDYCLVVLDEAIDFEPPADFDRDRIRQSAIDQMVLDLDDVLPITTLVVAARQTGTQVSPTMVDLVVNIAYVLDDSVLTDEKLEFDKVHFAAVATLNLV